MAMTMREFYNAILASDVAEDIKEVSRNELIKMDNRNAKRSSSPSKTALANEPIKAMILEYVEKNPVSVASIIAEKISTKENKFSTQKVNALCGQLVTDGKLSTEEVKIKGKGKVKGYSIIPKGTED